MQTISAEEWQLLSFFEVEPELTDTDVSNRPKGVTVGFEDSVLAHAADHALHSCARQHLLPTSQRAVWH
jgi:hypothetical protein